MPVQVLVRQLVRDPEGRVCAAESDAPVPQQQQDQRHECTVRDAMPSKAVLAGAGKGMAQHSVCKGTPK
jgi:hypothetical protein